MKDEVRVTGCRLAVRFYLDSKVAPYREGVLKVRMREARRLVDRSSRVHDGPLGSNCSMSEEGALFRITVGNRDYHHLSLTGAGSGIVREPCGFAFVFAYLLVLGLSLRDSDTANQSLEALILAQAVEYRLYFQVDHEIIAFLKTLPQPFERALFIADAHTCHGRQP